MHEKSSHSARVIFLDKGKIIEQLGAAARRLRTSSNVLDIKLFGSLTKGNFIPGSDADILIVLKRDSRRMMDRIPEFLAFFGNVDLPVEVFPYTENELEKMQADGNRFIREAVESGIRL